MHGVVFSCCPFVLQQPCTDLLRAIAFPLQTSSPQLTLVKKPGSSTSPFNRRKKLFASSASSMAQKMRWSTSRAWPTTRCHSTRTTSPMPIRKPIPTPTPAQMAMFTHLPPRQVLRPKYLIQKTNCRHDSSASSLLSLLLSSLHIAIAFGHFSIL